MSKTIVIGASGQIGSDLTLELRNRFGNDNVIASDIKNAADDVMSSGPFETLDVMDESGVAAVFKKHDISKVYLLAAMLSGSAEKNPKKAWDLNMKSLLSILDMAKEGLIKKVFWPSSIAVFGPTTPKQNTPQLTIMEPSTVYGISKLAGERWCEYYFNKYGVDVRGVRYPGLISYKTEAGGGTTDYAVEIFYEAIRAGKYECFLTENTLLPMMFMPDAIRATIDLVEAPAEKVKIRSSYNLSGISFDPETLAAEIKKHIPGFTISYKPDFRQQIAESWPGSIDDSEARADWGWKHEYDLAKMTDIMLKEIKKKLS
ncbi:MAG TPA: NAD-dependent epimerase/dehydratase family protein [Ignavibacteria bacterium]|nr:NAD-dependent epimerase [Bacteroidota bacterium]HRE12287.1 NAD-dependent epimerase/dehydratase family protein [Ignavibacteria bacterium]HRF65861.1 NAD-dependent epimerase/dehydratase family protein [Ignavibacteria bacterium]HRJ04517.1 NAD-dependent epimerase/dehydratase family protein [Ignavibacteria bacterium]